MNNHGQSATCPPMEPPMSRLPWIAAALVAGLAVAGCNRLYDPAIIGGIAGPGGADVPNPEDTEDRPDRPGGGPFVKPPEAPALR